MIGFWLRSMYFLINLQRDRIKRGSKSPRTPSKYDSRPLQAPNRINNQMNSRQQVRSFLLRLYIPRANSVWYFIM
jgi:hypothetical protein